MTRRLSRRALLGGIGAGALLSPFVPLLNTSAQESAIPRRIIFLFSPNGTIRNNWKPSGSQDDFTFGSILEPLEPYKSYVNVVDGLRYANGGAGNRHMQGPFKFMAGSGLLAGNEFTGGGDASSGWGGHISVDQEIASLVGQETPFASLEFGVQNGGAQVRSRMSYAGSHQPLAPEQDPYAMFDRLFKDFDQSEDELARLRAERQSVIDVVRAQLTSIEPMYASKDKLKVDAHLDALRAIEKRLDTSYGAACELPVVGDTIDHMAAENFQVVSRLQIDLMVMALTCDMTRVASLMWTSATSNKTFPFLGFTDKHHDLSHEGDSNTVAQDKLTDINHFYAGELAYLASRLAAVEEGDGTMLDNTLIVWGNELGKGNSHTHHPVPIIMLGGAQGHFRMGRNLDYGDVIHNRLLVSLCHYMGLPDVTSFGDLDTGSGPLDNLV
jgi:hypothetical protein